MKINDMKDFREADKRIGKLIEELVLDGVNREDITSALAGRIGFELRCLYPMKSDNIQRQERQQEIARYLVGS